MKITQRRARVRLINLASGLRLTRVAGGNTEQHRAGGVDYDVLRALFFFGRDLESGTETVSFYLRLCDDVVHTVFPKTVKGYAGTPLELRFTVLVTDGRYR